MVREWKWENFANKYVDFINPMKRQSWMKHPDGETENALPLSDFKAQSNEGDVQEPQPTSNTDTLPRL